MEKLGRASGGFQSMHIHHINGRLFKRLLSDEPEALYSSEQGKILTILWQNKLGGVIATEISNQTGLANNTLSTMLKRMEKQGFITIDISENDKRKKMITLTQLGWSQKEIADQVSDKLSDVFYKGFSEEDIERFESYQEKILNNLKTALKERDL